MPFNTSSAVMILLQFAWAAIHVERRHGGDWQSCEVEPCREARQIVGQGESAA